MLFFSQHFFLPEYHSVPTPLHAPQDTLQPIVHSPSYFFRFPITIDIDSLFIPGCLHLLLALCTCSSCMLKPTPGPVLPTSPSPSCLNKPKQLNILVSVTLFLLGIMGLLVLLRLICILYFISMVFLEFFSHSYSYTEL
jgi:hypothetical protein